MVGNSHKRGLFNLIHGLKHFLHPGNDNEDECDILMNNIYVENCFINELKERKRKLKTFVYTHYLAR
jgi:hypothetical protein